MNLLKLLLLSLALPVTAVAQLSDTLSEQVISGKRILKPLVPGGEGLKTLSIDSSQLLRPAFTDLSRILSENVPVFTRVTGVNGPVTLSIRGASAAQSMVLWEGVPLQNPAMGMTDLALLQSGLFQNIALVPGGTPALWGSGNVGGVLQLESRKPRFPEKTLWSGLAGGSGGSFGLWSGSAALERSGPKAYFGIRAFGSLADYTFTYAPQGGPSKTIDNASTRQAGGMLQAGQQLATGWQTQQTLWWSGANRHIPPALFEDGSAKRQQDEALRLRFSAEKAFPNATLKFISALMQEALRYTDGEINLYSALQTTTVFGRVQFEQRFDTRTFFVDAPLQYALVTTNGQTYSQNRLSLAAGGTQRLGKKATVSGVVRLENGDGKTIVLPGGNASFWLFPNSLLRASFQRSYRAPTLSELYYFPGGNTRLQPETGWGGEVGGGQRFRKGRWHATMEVTGFHRNIRDWIIWYGGAIWTPHNIARVRTQGVELEGESYWQLAESKLGLRGGYTYTTARTVESAVPNDGSVGCQIPHTPLTTARLGFWATRKKLRVDANTIYTGYRFTTSDESAWIPAYWLHSASVTYTLKMNKQTLNFEARCNNLVNTSFLSVAGRPGLPRHFTVGVLSQF